MSTPNNHIVYIIPIIIPRNINIIRHLNTSIVDLQPIMTQYERYLYLD